MKLFIAILGVVVAPAFAQPPSSAPSFLPWPPVGGVQVLPADQLSESTRQEMARIQKTKETGAIIRPGSMQSLRALEDIVGAFKPWKDVVDQVTIQPAVLHASVLAKFELIGYVAQGQHHIRRMYERAPGELLEFEEWDLRASQGGMIIIEELQNERVNGLHAQYMIETAMGTDRVIYRVRWATDDREYRIAFQTVGEKKADKAFLLALAQSVQP